MKSKFWDYSYYFLSGYTMHIIVTEKITILSSICLALFAMVIASEFYLGFIKRKAEKY